MEFIAKLKKLELAWKQRIITSAEYHGELNYFLRRLYDDESGGL